MQVCHRDAARTRMGPDFARDVGQAQVAGTRRHLGRTADPGYVLVPGARFRQHPGLGGNHQFVTDGNIAVPLGFTEMPNAHHVSVLLDRRIGCDCLHGCGRILCAEQRAAARLDRPMHGQRSGGAAADGDVARARHHLQIHRPVDLQRAIEGGLFAGQQGQGGHQHGYGKGNTRQISHGNLTCAGYAPGNSKLHFSYPLGDLKEQGIPDLEGSPGIPLHPIPRNTAA